MTSETTKSRDILSLGCRRDEYEKRTERDVELWGKVDRLADLNYTAYRRIVPETFEMENENGWKRLNEQLLARIAQAGRAILHGLRPGDAHEGILNGVYRIRL
jgi:hypothetical protein